MEFHKETPIHISMYVNIAIFVSVPRFVPVPVEFIELYKNFTIIRKKAAAFLQLLDSEVGAEGVEPPTLCL